MTCSRQSNDTHNPGHQRLWPADGAAMQHILTVTVAIGQLLQLKILASHVS